MVFFPELLVFLLQMLDFLLQRAEFFLQGLELGRQGRFALERVRSALAFGHPMGSWICLHRCPSRKNDQEPFFRGGNRTPLPPLLPAPR